MVSIDSKVIEQPMDIELPMYSALSTPQMRHSGSSPLKSSPFRKTFTRTINADEYSKALGQVNKKEIAVGTAGIVGPTGLMPQGSRAMDATQAQIRQAPSFRRSGRGSGSGTMYRNQRRTLPPMPMQLDTRGSSHNSLNGQLGGDSIDQFSSEQSLYEDEEDELLQWREYELGREEDDSIPYNSTVSNAVLQFFDKKVQAPIDLFTTQVKDRVKNSFMDSMGMIQSRLNNLFKRLGFHTVSSSSIE